MASCTGCEEPNTKQNCPNRMDYSSLTDYRFRCAQNAEIAAFVPVSPSAYLTRIYLQTHALEIIEQERKRATDRLAPCAPCRKPFTDPSTMLPESYVVRCDGSTCSIAQKDKNGLGVGRSYA